MHEGSKKAVLAALLANLGIAIAKFIAFFFTGAASMLAESIHSVADTGNQGLLFLGGIRSKRPETDEHPFGYSRAWYFWAFIVSMVLFSFGGVFAIWEGINKLLHPHELESPIWAFVVLIVAIILELFSFRTAIREANVVRGEKSWWCFIRRSKSPELPVVLLEDLGALVGLIFALVGVSLAVLLDNPLFDAAGSLAIGILLVLIAVILAKEMKSLLMGEAADEHELKMIRQAIESHTDVVRLIHIRTEHRGPDDLLIAAKVEFQNTLSALELINAINSVEAGVRDVLPIAQRIYLEPDIYK